MQSGDSIDNVPRSDAWRNNNAEKIAYGMDRYSWNQGYNALYDFQMFEEQEPSLVARGGGSGLLLYQKEIGALCASDHKWIQQQQVMENKLIICKR